MSEFQIDQDKEVIRRIIRSEKLKYPSSYLMFLSEKIIMQLEKNTYFQKAKVILAYWSLSGEVYTHDFVNKWAKKKKILLPVIEGLNLVLKEFDGNEKHMVKGSFQISEPVGNIFTDINKIDLAVIPGIAFDKKGNRLGRGKGFYDRLLVNIQARKVGLCFPFQYMENIPADKFDVKMDEVITMCN